MKLVTLVFSMFFLTPCFAAGGAAAGGGAAGGVGATPGGATQGTNTGAATTRNGQPVPGMTTNPHTINTPAGSMNPPVTDPAGTARSVAPGNDAEIGAGSQSLGRSAVNPGPDFQSLDTDGDDRISPEEARRAPGSITSFDDLDTDHSGTVNPDEFRRGSAR